MTSSEQCLSRLVDLARSNHLSALAQMDGIVDAYLSALPDPFEIERARQDLADAFLRVAPDTDIKAQLHQRILLRQEPPSA